MAKKQIDMYPEELLVTIENDQGKVFYVAHENPHDVMKQNSLYGTIACVYKRDRRVVISAEIKARDASETDDAKD